MNEDQILLQFQKGDQLAFKAVYEKFYESVYRFTKRLTEDTHEGENIALDLFVKLWERRENFETLQNIKAFLFISARNACLNFLKARKRNRLTTEEALAIVTEKEKVADYYIIKSEILRALDEEIQKL